MSNASPFDMDEFMKDDPPPEQTESATSEYAEEADGEETEEAPELDVQKAVVEAFAEEKVKLEHELETLRQSVAAKEAEIAHLAKEAESLKADADRKASEASAALAAKDDKINALNGRVAELERDLAAQMEKEFDAQERNPNALALLDRDVELPDRFPGETRDHVIEVLKEARDAAEVDGRIRRAQILESVLVANEPNGALVKKREEMEAIFASNQNLVTGVVIEELKKRGLTHKSGETYLMPAEIMKREF